MFTRILFHLFCSFSLITTLSAEVLIRISSDNLVVGEKIRITYKITDLAEAPEIPRPKLAQGKLRYDDGRVDRIRGKLYYTFYYEFQATQAGAVTIPALEFKTRGATSKSSEIELTVNELGKLHKSSLKTNGRTHNYFTLLSANKAELFPNETTTLEYKIYIPKVLNVALWGLPLGEYTNCTAWRFEIPQLRETAGSVIVDGKSYQVAVYRTTLTANQPGKASFGPLRTRIVYNANVIGATGSFQDQFEIHPVSESLDLKVIPLPPNAPEEFQGEVGTYQIEAEVNSKPEMKDSESIQAIVRVTGLGNISGIAPPSLVNDDDWQLITQNKSDLGDKRKRRFGTAEFTYLIQPKAIESPLETSTPAFSFSYLDPELKVYRIIKLPGKPITIVPSGASDPGSKSSTQETKNDKTDIYPILSSHSPAAQNHLVHSLTKNFIWIIHLFFGGLAFLILMIKLRSHLASRKLRNQDLTQKRQEYNLLVKNDQDFLKSAANYVEKWIDIQKHPEAAPIIRERDAKCFLPDDDARNALSDSNRNKIIKLLKKISFVMIVCLSIPQAYAAESDFTQQGIAYYESGEYQKSIDTISKAPPSFQTYYNLGNAYYRIKDPAQAAYYYHLALEMKPHDASAVHNLRLVEDESNSIQLQPNEVESWVSTFSVNTYLYALIISTWIIILAILTLYLLKPKNGKLGFCILSITLSLMILAVSLLAYYKHPRKDFQHLQKALVTKNTPLLSEPFADSGTTSHVTLASECYVIADRGEFLFIVLLSGEKGWIAREDLRKITLS